MPDAPFPLPAPLTVPQQTAGAPAGHGRAPRGLDTVALGQKEFVRFGRMFPELRSLNVPDEKLRLLAAKMVDTGAAAADNANVPSGYTYLGQFIDHDITLDTSSLGERRKDPHALEDFRTPRLDLDNVYGDGPVGSPFLYDRTDARKMALGACGPGLAGDPSVKSGLRHDLPRSREGLALIGDPRNDENLLVAQTHVAFLRFHNAVVDLLDPNRTQDPGSLFDLARQTVTWHYQWIVLHDFLDRLIDMNELHDVLTHGRKYFRFDGANTKFGVPFMPVEFSVAGYRLGHSMIRENYNHNRAFAPADFKLLFNFTGLSGGIVGDLFTAPVGSPANQALATALKLLPPGVVIDRLPGDWIIDWHRFYDLGADEPPPPPPAKPGDNFSLNLSRRLDPYLAAVLQNLPGGGDSLPFRNLARGVRMGLPSGQDVARLMRAPVLTPAQLAGNGPEGQTDGDTLQELGLTEATPLWYYVLKEALLLGDGGARLGPVGSRILAEVFVGMLQGDAESFLSQQPDWRPFLPAANPGAFTMPDLLRIAGELNPINDPANIGQPPQH